MSKRDPIWRPYTQHKTMGQPLEIERGAGAMLYTSDGREIVDLISSWWVNLHGHCHPTIAAAIARQASTLEHVIFAGMTHQPAAHLAKGLIEKAGDPFAHIFYTDNGSTAVESALKMAIHEAGNRGDEKRKSVIAFEGGYHGDTWAAMAAGKTSGYFQAYEPLAAPQMFHIPFPATWHEDADVEAKEAESIGRLKEVLDQHGSQIAALLIEPMIQGAGGMRICRSSWLEDVVRLTKQYQVRVIFDEVMTGFGRTGKMFAFEHLDADVRPDIVCLSKAITGGFLPLAVTMTTAEIFDAFLGDSFEQAFAHGHSYTANPIACAAAVAGLGLFQSEQTLEKIATIEQVYQQQIFDLPGTCQHRILGNIAACELQSASPAYASRLSVDLRHEFIREGLLIRPLGNTLYFMPPACIDPDVLSRSIQICGKLLRSAVAAD